MCSAWVHIASKCGSDGGQKCEESFDTISQTYNDLHRDLQMNGVSSEIQRFAQNMKGGFTIMRTLRPYCY